MEQKKSTDVQQDQSSNLQNMQAGKGNAQNGIPAHQAAEADMQQDPDLNDVTGPDDGLDEGELARLEGEE